MKIPVSGYRRLTWEQVVCLRRAYSRGEKTQAQLAREYGISQTAISYIIIRRHYKFSDAQIKKRRKEINKERLLRRRAREKGLKVEDVRAVAKRKRCDICGARKTGRWGTLHIDHKEKKVRGLLCIRCNQGLGSFEDSPKLLEKAARYLRKNR